ncbi:MAGUK p55 subfamily member 7-like isoform X3 [Betta splendens]|uniref:MAGUK p55 subfamily member 7-like isoform X3 n=1 Tax=Betta splendens TaxID=158456 RepID=A0A9W2XD88_BETSP|nr:MAGUK p55 subfamily member 7-like isoform X3 [Betta splendens]
MVSNKNHPQCIIGRVATLSAWLGRNSSTESSTVRRKRRRRTRQCRWTACRRGVCVQYYVGVWCAPPPPPPPDACRLLSPVMSGAGSHADREEDYRFLHSMLMEKKLHLLFKIHERLRRFESRCPSAVQEHAASLASDLAKDLMYQSQKDEVKELVALLNQALFKSLLSVHDAVAQKDFQPTLPPIPDDTLEEEEDSVKLVSLVKTKEPLGATIKKDQSTGAIIVARIMQGGAADKSGLIHEGDELKEVNGVSLEHRKPKEILPLLARSQSEIKFKIVPAFDRKDVSSNKAKLFVRALFDYDPGEDPAVPCKAAAVAFKRGDVLQVVSAEDDVWWQARLLRDGRARAGLIPSQQLQERRVALQRPEALFRPRREKPPASEDVDYGAITGIHIGEALGGIRRSFRLGKKSSLTTDAAGSRRWSAGMHGSVCPPTYIEVMPYHSPPEDRGRLVVLVGPSGVGVNELKRRLLISDPDRYGVAVPHTTRERRAREAEGVHYHFVSVHAFEEAVLKHKFIEYGRHTGQYYGTSLDSVHQVLAKGKVCLLDVHPSKIKVVYTSEFKPHVVFVKPPCVEELRLTRRRAEAPGDPKDTNPLRIFSDQDLEDMGAQAEAIDSQYGHLFDRVIINSDMAAALRELRGDLERTEGEEDVRWVPAEWIRSLERRSCGRLSSWI